MCVYPIMDIFLKCILKSPLSTLWQVCQFNYLFTRILFNVKFVFDFRLCKMSRQQKKVSLKSAIIVMALIYEVEKKEVQMQKRRKDEQMVATRIM